MNPRVATRDESLAAVVVERVPLRYAEGADLGVDRPAHIRAGSSLARTRHGIALIQDDANFVGIFENDGAGVRAIVLPAGAAGKRQFDDRRGNKAHKLGALSGIPLSFTDAALWRDAMFYSASAEDSPDATRDGRVMGSAVGLIESSGRIRWAPLTDPSGALFAGKVEGLLPADDTGDRLLIVVDADDPDAASELCTVELNGKWD